MQNVCTRFQSEIEKQIATIWQKQLAKESVGPLDDFFGLGGDSISMISMLFAIQDAFGVQLPLEAVFTKSSLREFAAVVDLALERGPQVTTLTDGSSFRDSV